VNLLLDTCTFIWITTDSRELSDRARGLFVDPVNDVYLSTVSTWEIALKHGLGRLPLPEPADRFIPAERERHLIRTLALDEESALQLIRLPHLHDDPFDRMLICQAIVHGLALLTPDPWISKYPVKSVW
jgi:PIN domain nuclease of toxin-antitoxin system